MTTRQQLIDFRAKLVRAMEIAMLAPSQAAGMAMLEAIEKVGLHKLIDRKGCNFVAPEILDWYLGETRAKRLLMWNNSIAHADKLIEEAE